VRHGFAQRIGTDERALADTPVLDPARTVRTDVERVLWAEEIPQNVRVSGHVYDLGTGLVTTIVDVKKPEISSRSDRLIPASEAAKGLVPSPARQAGSVPP
jgi:hypothetical protein